MYTVGPLVERIPASRFATIAAGAVGLPLVAAATVDGFLVALFGMVAGAAATAGGAAAAGDRADRGCRPIGRASGLQVPDPARERAGGAERERRGAVQVGDRGGRARAGGAARAADRGVDAGGDRSGGGGRRDR